MMSKRLKRMSNLCLATILSLSTITVTHANGNVETIKGLNRTETSIKTALKDKTKIKNLVLASGKSFADSLSSVNLINHYPNSKLILVTENIDIKNIIKEINPEKIFVIGGTDTISDSFIKKINERQIPVTRISGKSRYETNEKTLEFFTEVGVADGRNYPDALSASPLLKKEKLGLMLVNGSKMYITNKTVKYTFGSTDSIKQEGGQRLAGNSRYETNEKINEKLSEFNENIITYGGNYADALSSINLLNGNNSIILLNNKYVSPLNQDLIKKNKNMIIGGLLDKSYQNIHNISHNRKHLTIDRYNPLDLDNNTVEKPIDPKTPLPKFDFSGAIKTQKDLDKYILSRYVRGIDNKGETVELANSSINTISDALDYIIEDTGLKLKTEKKKETN